MVCPCGWFRFRRWPVTGNAEQPGVQCQVEQRGVDGRRESFAGESLYPLEAVQDRIAVQVQVLSDRGGGAAEFKPGQRGVHEQPGVRGIESIECGEQVGEDVCGQLGVRGNQRTFRCRRVGVAPRLGRVRAAEGESCLFQCSGRVGEIGEKPARARTVRSARSSAADAAATTRVTESPSSTVDAVVTPTASKRTSPTSTTEVARAGRFIRRPSSAR